MQSVKIAPLAEQDIMLACLWYEEVQPDLGKRFLFVLRKYIDRIQNQPELYAIKYDNIRTAVIRPFPYVLHYTIENDGEILVIALNDPPQSYLMHT